MIYLQQKARHIQREFKNRADEIQAVQKVLMGCEVEELLSEQQLCLPHPSSDPTPIFLSLNKAKVAFDPLNLPKLHSKDSELLDQERNPNQNRHEATQTCKTGHIYLKRDPLKFSDVREMPCFQHLEGSLYSLKSFMPHTPKGEDYLLTDTLHPTIQRRGMLMKWTS